jgi:predicted transcriptional regulator
VLEKLVASGNKSFPVLDGDELVGIVSREDVLRGLRTAAPGRPRGT